jgi:hypothetical protein
MMIQQHLFTDAEVQTMAAHLLAYAERYADDRLPEREEATHRWLDRACSREHVDGYQASNHFRVYRWYQKLGADKHGWAYSEASPPQGAARGPSKETTMTPTDQVITALVANGYERGERPQRFTVYRRQADNAVVGLETFDDGGCFLWGPLTHLDDVEAMIAAIP